MKTTKKFHVAGTTFSGRQGYICYINRSKANAYCSLRRERTCAADANAIAVIGHVRGGKHVTLGYVPRELARELATSRSSVAARSAPTASCWTSRTRKWNEKEYQPCLRTSSTSTFS